MRFELARLRVRLPLRMSSISSRTNSLATVLGDLPARAFRRAFQRAFFGHGVSFRKVFSTHPSPAPALRAANETAAARAVEVEVEHRHGGAKRRALAAAACLGGTL